MVDFVPFHKLSREGNVKVGIIKYIVLENIYILQISFFSFRLCKSYDEISDKVQEMPDNTKDLVALTQFLENASSVTVVNLQTAVDEAGERLLFLLDYATLPCM